MRHLKNASVTDATMVCSSRLHIIAMFTLSSPDASKVAHSLCTIFYQTFDILLKTFETIVLRDLLFPFLVRDCALALNDDFSGFAVFSLLDFFPKLLILL